MAVTEGPLGVFQNTTEIIFFIPNLLVNVTVRTLPFTALDTTRDLSHSPACTKSCWCDTFAAILWNQVVLSFTVVIATKSTNCSHVVTGKCDIQITLPVEGDFEAKVCFHNGIPAALIHRYLSFSQGHRQVDKLVINLEENTQLYCDEIIRRKQINIYLP